MQQVEVIIRLDMMLAREKMSIAQLSKMVDIHVTNLSVMKNGHGRAIKYSSMGKICAALNCTPNDLFEIRIIPTRYSVKDRKEITETGDSEFPA